MKPKRKFIEGHSYVEIHTFTRALSFWELEESYKALENYMKENHDVQIPVCVRLKTGDIRVKKYDEQIGLDPRDYYSNAHDLQYVVRDAYNSRIIMRERFLEGEVSEYPQSSVSECSPTELLNLKEFLTALDDEWVYFDKTKTKDGEKCYIFEVVDADIIRTISKRAITEVKKRNTFLFKYGDKNTQALDSEHIENLLNHFRPAENLLEEVYEAIWAI